MGMSIYEIDQRLLNLVNPETGEIEDFDAFEQLHMEREQKIENVACWIKNLDAEAKAIKEEENNLHARRVVLENREKRLKAYLSDALNGEKFSSTRCAVSFRHSKSLNVIDSTAAADWLANNGLNNLVIQQMPTIDKKAVKDMVISGINVPGVEISENISVGVK